MTPGAYRAAAGKPAPDAPATAETLASTAPDHRRGKLALTQYACQSCHMIPGVTGPQTFVGPDLDGLAQRTLVAGTLPRNEANLVRWLRAPHEVKPGTAMPDLGVTERDARDMAAYLLRASQ
jgi:cytochrome c2